MLAIHVLVHPLLDAALVAELVRASSLKRLVRLQPDPLDDVSVAILGNPCILFRNSMVEPSSIRELSCGWERLRREEQVDFSPSNRNALIRRQRSKIVQRRTATAKAGREEKGGRRASPYLVGWKASRIYNELCAVGHNFLSPKRIERVRRADPRVSAPYVARVDQAS